MRGIGERTLFELKDFFNGFFPDRFGPPGHKQSLLARRQALPLREGTEPFENRLQLCFFPFPFKEVWLCCVREPENLNRMTALFPWQGAEAKLRFGGFQERFVTL